MRVLLVEPDYRRGTEAAIAAARQQSDGVPRKKRDDETLWYPPLGLMKLATFHRRRGDEVCFVIGRDKAVFDSDVFKAEEDLFAPAVHWDRVYISTLFTFDWDNTIRTIEFYKSAVGGSSHKIYIGGIMASLMPQDIYEETGIYPVTGILSSPQQIDMEGDEIIDELPPDYDILDGRLYGAVSTEPAGEIRYGKLYATSDTYYGYTTRGCTNRCPWCGVPDIEPNYCERIAIGPMLETMEELYGEKARLKLMDNNVLASPQLPAIVDELVRLGFGKGMTTRSLPRRMRVIDFNQGLDASYLTEDNLALLSRLNIRPMRVAFDRLQEKVVYEKALRLAHQYGFREFSNYMLYNCNDTPRDLYERLMLNIRLNEEWGQGKSKTEGVVYSYPMRYAPIKDETPRKENRRRDYVPPEPTEPYDHLTDARWNRRFTRNMEIIKGATHGAISPTPGLALRAIGETYEEFMANLYMPEELLRNRNKHEARRYANDTARAPGSGLVEEFRTFVLKLLEKQDERFFFFHETVSKNSRDAVRSAMADADKEMHKWLNMYLDK